MCLGLSRHFTHDFFVNFLKDGPLKKFHTSLFKIYMQRVRIAEVFADKGDLNLNTCAVDVCDCKMVAGNCQDRVDICYKLNSPKGGLDVNYDKNEKSQQLLDKGYVRLKIITLNKKIEICHCCKCCCMILDVQRLIPELLVYPSGQIPEKKAETTCLACRKCEEVCPLRIRQFDQVDEKRCIGCGACVRLCPNKAWQMKKTDKKKKLPAINTFFGFGFALFLMIYMNIFLFFYRHLK